MATTITTRYNQSMNDVVVQATGSQEAAWQFCLDNDVSLSDVPVPGTVYDVSDAALALGDAKLLETLNQRAKTGIYLGTLNRKLDLNWRMALYVPSIAAIHTGVTTPPGTLGYWNIDVTPVAAAMVCLYGLSAIRYASSPNNIAYEGLDDIIAGTPGSAATQVGDPLQTGELVNYHVPFANVTRAMIVQKGVKVITYTDANGNTVQTQPWVALKTTGQSVLESLQPILVVEKVTGDDTAVTLRVQTNHTAEVAGLVTSIVLTFTDEAAGGTSDPLAPTNNLITIVTLGAGTHTLGVQAQYKNGTHTVGYSVIEMVVEVY